MRGDPVPDPSVRRLSMYLTQLERLVAAGAERVSSQQLADALHVGAAQIRRDLALFGQFGRPGIGYRIRSLIQQLRLVLGTHKPWNVIVVGAGQLGRALLKYAAFPKRGFRLVAAFDVVPKKIGHVVVRKLEDLPEIVRRHDVKLAILAVPADAAEETAAMLYEAGVQGILNFAPTSLDLPPDIAVDYVDLAAHLERLSFKVSHNGSPPGSARRARSPRRQSKRARPPRVTSKL